MSVRDPGDVRGRGDALGESLLAAIHADPDDDAARSVYADWLADRGDPQGELIQLQLAHLRAAPSPAALRRERALIKEHREAWLGPLWHVVRRTHIRFERGFASKLTLRPLIKPKQMARAIGEPRWRTVRSLDVWGFDYPELVLHEVMREIRTLLSVPAELALAILRDRRPRSLRMLELQRAPVDPPLRNALVASRALPALAHLQFKHDRGPEALDWLWDSPLGRQLDTLTLRGTSSPQAWSVSTQVPANILAVHLRSRDTVVTLRRGTSGKLEAATG